MFEDLLALSIVVFVKKGDVEDQILHLRCPFGHQRERRPFFLHWRFLFCHVFLSLLVQVKNGDESESQQLELSRLSRSHEHMHERGSDICISIYIYIYQVGTYIIVRLCKELSLKDLTAEASGDFFFPWPR